jgi:hypothetical protein
MAKVLVFDIDGVIATGTKEQVYSDHAGWAFERCTLVPGILTTLLYFRNKGYKIVLNTARWAQDLEKTDKWLRENEVPFDELRMEKPAAMLYVDDKAYRHTGKWTITDIAEMEMILEQEEEVFESKLEGR